jgi:L-aminopeptidase/D-esterase-like protein
MNDNPVHLPDYKVDELFRAAMRCVEESLKGGMLDGTPMVRVPEGIFGRLRRIVASCEKDAGDWRP